MKNLFNNKRTIRHMALLIGMVAVVIASVVGCKKEDKNGQGSCEFQQELAVLIQAQQAYHDDENRATCNAYKDAAVKLEAKAKNCPAFKDLPAAQRALIEQYRNYDCNANHTN